ncbi:FecR domain-containing protein [Polaromonas sp.]|uniref:FecR domain-containing protein n=1 Tax=Polaromonas sp. TaxID=1869339 RepID=UPI00286A9535|nr:FecR domain-containing protein [Polaromonas sp.]
MASCQLAMAQAEAGSMPREPSMPYTVKASDKLIVMSRQLLNSPGDWKEVARFNGMKNPNAIRVGQVLQIPLRFMQAQPASAKIISSNGDVQLAGSPAAVGTAVAEGGQLQTGANSSAVLELADGSRVTLLPNTLAELVTHRSYATRDVAKSGSSTWFSGLVRLAQGGLDTLAAKTTRRATPLLIQTPTSTVGVRGTEFRVAYDDPATQNARTEVLEGAVRADNTAQKSGAELARGQGAVLNPGVKDIKVVDLLKAPDLSATPADILKPQALWPMPMLEGAQNFRVQVAIDETFSKIVRNLVVSNGNADLSSLPNGFWFARIRGIDAGGVEGFDSVRAVQVVLPPPPEVPPTQWSLSNDRLDVANGRHVLQFSQMGLDASHTIHASVSADLPPYTPMAEASANGAVPRIALDLGILEPGARLRLNLTVTQADGAKVIPLAYLITGQSGWGWFEGVLQPVPVVKP